MTHAWLDEEMMVYWVRHLWNSQSIFSGANEKRSRLLVYDQHKAQTTKKVKMNARPHWPQSHQELEAKFSPQMLKSTVNSKRLLIVWQQRQLPETPTSYLQGKLLQAKEGCFIRNGQGKPGKRFLALSEIQLFALLLSDPSVRNHLAKFRTTR